MCGIAGIAYADPNRRPDLRLIDNMCEAIRHRGPDEGGVYITAGAGLGFRRLSIVDVAGGHQPIFNERHTVAVVCNGEIYNYRELRAALAQSGHAFATASDVEVIVHLYEEYGLDFLSRLRGMFALALWDEQRRHLLIARDRLGIKPIYYAVLPGGIAFASEIKALLAVPGVPRVPSLAAIDTYLSHRFVPAPDTLFKDVRKVEPGHYLLYQDGKLHCREYWRLPAPGEASLDGRFAEDDYAGLLFSLLDETVSRHLQGDVPIGVFLSSGVDSNALLALAARRVDYQIPTFSLGFSGPNGPHPGFNELDLTRRLAARYATAHVEATLSPDEVPASLPQMIRSLEEPLGDPSIIPLYFISRLASRHVKAVLSGEGADELFAGYNVYRTAEATAIFRLLPPWLRDYVVAPLARFFPPQWRGYHLLQRATEPVPSWYRGVGSTFSEQEKKRLYAPEMARRLSRAGQAAPKAGWNGHIDHMLAGMLYFDTRFTLGDDTLLRTDKLGMAYGLEVRVPFLDHQVVELAARIPAALKLRRGTLKYILKKAVAPVVPAEILYRPKAGFVAPISAWVESSWRDYARDLLESPRFIARGYFDPQAIHDLLQPERPARLSPARGRQIFTLMMLELWHQVFIDSPFRVRQDLAEPVWK